MDSEDPLEAHAIARVQQGDTAAYDYLVSKYLPRVVSIAWGVVRNAHDAEDLAQEAFVRAFQGMSRFRPGQSFGPWIYRIVTNAALDVRRHRTKFQSEELFGNERLTRADESETAAVGSQVSSRIDAAIESLPEMQRLVARLHLVEQFEHDEIAGITGLSEGTIRSHLSLARKKLKEMLADLYGERE